MSSGQVIKAAQMFKKAGQGNSANVNLKYEMAMGMSLGVVDGLGWKVILVNSDTQRLEYRLCCWSGDIEANVFRLFWLCAQVYHWNEKRKQAEYYTTLAKLESQKE